MTDETDAQQGGADGVDAPEAVETNPEATTGQPTGTVEPGSADDAGDATEGPTKRVPWFQKRIDEVTAKKYEAERDAAYWRGIAEGRTPAQQPPAQEVGPPDRWEDPEGYDQWLIGQAVEQFTQQTQRQNASRTYEEREAQAKQAHPDFDSVVRNPNLKITPLMADVIRESDVGPQVAYHLGTNPEEAQRISALSPVRQAAELGRIEAALTKAPPPAPKPIPPAPPQTVSGLSAGLSKAPEDMPMNEYMQWVKTRDQ